MFGFAANALLSSESLAEKAVQKAQVGPADHRTWLGFIPVQVGPPTAYAKSITHWLHFILLLMTIVLVLRLVVLVDILGGLWMIAAIALGFYAWHSDMNISYICVWGLICAMNCIFDAIGQAIPILLSLTSLSLLSTAVRVSIPVVYFVAAFFALHVYHDYEDAHGHRPLVAADPLGKFFDRYDPNEHLPLSAVEKAETRSFAGIQGLFSGHKDPFISSPQAAPSSYFSSVPGLRQSGEDIQQRATSAYGALSAAEPGFSATGRSAQGQAQEASTGFFSALTGPR